MAADEPYSLPNLIKSASGGWACLTVLNDRAMATASMGSVMMLLVVCTFRLMVCIPVSDVETLANPVTSVTAGHSIPIGLTPINL